MALYITYERIVPGPDEEIYGPSARKTHEWHVGEKLPADLFDQCCEHRADSIERVICIQASGDELTWVEENFKNVPMLTEPVAYWYGDIARSIVAKLPEQF